MTDEPKTLPATSVSMTLAHVDTCQCRYVLVDGDDVKLIDARCILAYVVPGAIQLF